MLLRAVVAAREREDQRIVALQLAELAGDVLCDRAARSRETCRRARCRSAWSDRLSGRGLSADELLAAVDVVGRAGERRVGHDVHGERGDVGRSDDAPDRKRVAKLLRVARSSASPSSDADRGVSTKPAAMRLTRTGAISSARLAVRAGSAAVIAELIPRPSAGSTRPGAAHEQQRASGAHLAGGVAGDAEHQHRMLAGARGAPRRSPSPPAARSRGRRRSPSRGRSVPAGSRRTPPAQPSRRRRTPRCSTRRPRRPRSCSRSGSRPVRITSAPSARARRAVSSPMPALPPITTTVCPSSSGSRSWALCECRGVIVSPSVSPPSAVRCRSARTLPRSRRGAP